MALIQIAEPGQSTTAHQHHLAIGIDLGTTNSLVATLRSGEVATLADSAGEHLLPSVVHYGKNKTSVGKAARQHNLSDPLNTLVSVKRLMGRGQTEILQEIKEGISHFQYQFSSTSQNVAKIKTQQGEISAIEASAEILKSLKQRAEKTLGDKIEGAVITVPAYFDDAQRQATKDAAKLADINLLRLLNEPTAAAVAYGLESKQEGNIAVYDLGGGTFDISILRLNKGVFEVLATGGDSALGGDDFDYEIAKWIMQQAKLAGEQTPKIQRLIMQEARFAKEQLAIKEQVILKITLAGKPWQAELTRDILKKLITPLIQKTLLSCRRVLRDSDIEKNQINEIVMVGGSTRTLLVREMVADFFEKEPLTTINPDKVVAIGAALQADVLVGNKGKGEMLLLDVIPLSLGIETMGGLVEKIIYRNTAIPVAKAQEFTTYKDGQTAMAVHVLQGEREMVRDCRSLARFELRGIPPQVAGAPRILVTFQVDADGLLQVSAREENSQVEATVDVKPSYGLSDSEIETMLKDSIEHAKEDIQKRSLAEQQVEAKRVLEALDSALAVDAKQLLTEAELKLILQAREDLNKVQFSDEIDAIKQNIQHLEKVCENYVARRMNSNIKRAMKGHTIDEYTAD